MNRIVGPVVLGAMCLLVSCTAGEKPRAADAVAPAPAHQDFGNLRVHFNAIPTLAMSEAVARQYDVQRNADKALLTVALRTVAGNEELAAEGEVQAVAVDLQGMRQTIAFTPARTGDYTDYIGTFRIAERDSYRFEITVKSGPRGGKVKFQRNF